jgi:hypothetical protein
LALTKLKSQLIKLFDETLRDFVALAFGVKMSSPGEIAAVMIANPELVRQGSGRVFSAHDFGSSVIDFGCQPTTCCLLFLLALSEASAGSLACLGRSGIRTSAG